MEPRVKELERCFAAYPDAPKEVIVKDDLLRLGVRFSTAAVDHPEVRQGRGKNFFLFTYDTGGISEEDSKRGIHIPDDPRIGGGPYNLIHTYFKLYLTSESPYQIDVVDGKLVLLADGKYLADVSVDRAPDYHKKQFEDGTTYFEVAPVVGCSRGVAVTAFSYCQYWGRKEECKYCNINSNARTAKKMKWLRQPKPYKDVTQVAVAVKAAFDESEKAPPENKLMSILLTGGTITTQLGGKTEVEFYSEFIEAIRRQIGGRYPIMAQIGAQSREDLQRYREAGAAVFHGNMEVWDKRLFEIICPGKAKFIGWERWRDLLLQAVDVFGEGNVNPNFVTGVEMARPHGFETTDEALESTLGGFDFLMRHGVIPRPVHWFRSPGSFLRGSEAVPLDYNVQLDLGWVQLWKKHNLPPPCGEGPIGLGRSRWGFAGFGDCVVIPEPRAGNVRPEPRLGISSSAYWDAGRG